MLDKMNCKPSKNMRADNDLNLTSIMHGIPPEVILEAPILRYGVFASLSWFVSSLDELK